ncbi:MAG: hypothetical protein JXR50_02145 [Prolixibacteraceae bacterium]|nr:hypothetical protein [Prolixibacteraceae bacterium]MBN2648519.1 hypothetical protein [Prolixibacteraceae bacterium]
MDKRQFFKTGFMGIGALLVSSKLKALEFYPTSPVKKWAVVYSTWCGSSRDAGVWISEGMDGIADVFDVRENPDLSKYENLVIGGSIRSGKVSNQMQEFLAQNNSALKGRVRGLFAVCGNMMQPVGPEQTKTLIDNHLAKLCDTDNVLSKVFLGRITYGLMDKDSRQMMEGFDMPEYDNLKRADCMAFGKEILSNA